MQRQRGHSTLGIHCSLENLYLIKCCYIAVYSFLVANFIFVVCLPLFPFIYNSLYYVCQGNTLTFIFCVIIRIYLLYRLMITKIIMVVFCLFSFPSTAFTHPCRLPVASPLHDTVHHAFPLPSLKQHTCILASSNCLYFTAYIITSLPPFTPVSSS